MIYSFEDYELDPSQYELRKGGMVCAIEPKAFDLLHFLIRNRDRLVTKDEVHETIWQGRIVSEATVDSCVNAARRAIGDDGKQQRLVRTLPRRGFRFIGEVNEQSEDIPAEALIGTGSEATSSNLPSIAVLPFKNMSGDPGQEFFADGIAEDLITELSRFRWLTIIARTSSFAFRDEKLVMRKIAEELGVRYVLEGSVRRAANRLRVTAQLIDAASDKHLWAQNYDGDLDDIFELQDDITHRVSASLQPEIEKAEWQRIQENRTASFNAWELYLKGIWHFYKHTEPDSQAAMDFLHQAIELDEHFGQAYAALAYTKFHAVTDGYTDKPDHELQEALKLAQKAIEIDDHDAFAHFVLGRVYSVTMDHDQAISELEFAIKINPSLADAYHGLGFAYTYSGNPEAAIPHFEKAYELSPHDPNVWAFFGIRAAAYIELEQYDDAVRYGREAVKKRYAKFWAYSHLTSALGHAGKTEDARKALADLLARKPDFTIAFARKHLYYYRDKGTLEHYLDGLRKAGLPEE